MIVNLGRMLLARRNLMLMPFMALAPGVRADSLSGDDPLPPGVTPAPIAERRVGLNFSIWFKPHAGPHHAWGTPLRGYYRSDDPAVFRDQAAEIASCGVDFLILDASNDTGSDIRTGQGTPEQLFEERVIAMIFEQLEAMASPLKLVIMIGYPTLPDLFNGRLSAKADELHALYVENPRHAARLEYYRGKPLLIVYGLTPSPFHGGLPPWHDDRFTVRHMTSFLTQQPQLLGRAATGTEKVSRFGYWSWQDRQAPAYPIVDGHPEEMTLTAYWFPDGPPHGPAHKPGRGRDGGTTYLADWARARRIGPKFAIAGTYNEWAVSEQRSPEMSKDLEPSVEFGYFYMQLLQRQVALFKAGK